MFDALAGSTGHEWALAALAAIGTFIAVHYGVLALMLRLARGVSLKDTVRVDCVLIDAGLVSLGAVAAALWEVNQALVALTLLPLALAYRSLAIPGLIEATRVEPKTGLYNMRHFNVVLTQELERARRFGRPLAVLMIDVDHLRAVNTAHGHLAGDRVLKDVADALGRATREYDIAARFGGDEFCVLLPETVDGASVVAERIRSLVETMSGEPPITVSIGVATQLGGRGDTGRAGRARRPRRLPSQVQRSKQRGRPARGRPGARGRARPPRRAGRLALLNERAGHGAQGRSHARARSATGWQERPPRTREEPDRRLHQKSESVNPAAIAPGTMRMKALSTISMDG